MSNQSKSVQGQLLHRSDNSLLAEGSLNAMLVHDESANDRPKFLATMTVKGKHPDLDSKIHKLKLGEGLEGEVLVSLEGFPDEDHTKFAVVFRGEVWHKKDWFTSV